MNYATRSVRLVGSGGTISVPPSRLVGIRSRALNGSWGGTVGWAAAKYPGVGATWAGGSTFLQDNEPFVEGDIVITGTPGDDVVAHIRF